MSNAILERFRIAIAEMGDMAMLVAADALQDNYSEENETLANLLRTYVEGQTMIRMSMTPSLAFAKRFQELQAQFNTKAERVIPNYYGGQVHPTARPVLPRADRSAELARREPQLAFDRACP